VLPLGFIGAEIASGKFGAFVERAITADAFVLGVRLAFRFLVAAEESLVLFPVLVRIERTSRADADFTCRFHGYFVNE